jgi:hypothetical protein
MKHYPIFKRENNASEKYLKHETEDQYNETPLQIHPND